MVTADLYPPGPADVPADLTVASASYRRRAYLAVAGLLVFLGGYLALASWFTWSAYHLLDVGFHTTRNSGGYLLGGAGTAFLAVFMWKALIFIRRGSTDDAVELERKDHPRLFEFLDRVADDAHAPRPHRVFLSAQVNAAVFYDLTVLNLLVPSRKNLVIGLGLVNVFDLTELKAVLAHEFGHFAQRSMAVGRWVYTAQQIASHVVTKRDFLDRTLQWISTFDLRVAWIGWILRMIVWSIRSLVDTVFGWVVIAERALSREMELQADLVAVSLTGSDPLINALHRLGAADDAMGRALSFVNSQHRQGKRVADLFAIQAEMITRKRQILDDPSWGEVPAPTGDPARHRLFETQLAHPPQMWSTHPPSAVREENAKRRYLVAPVDRRSAWTLFDQPERVRAEVTARLYRKEEKPTTLVPMAETMAALAETFDRRFLDPSYRGVYLGRSAVRAAATAAELYDRAPSSASPVELAPALTALYPSTLTVDLQRARELDEQKDLLAAIQRGVAEAPGGVIRFRGQEYHRRQLPDLLARVEGELQTAERAVTDHDRRVRSQHLAAARVLGQGWEEHLRGLAAVLHYADHAEADLSDAMGAFKNVLAVVFADHKVTAEEAERVVAAANEVYLAIADFHRQAGEVELGPLLAGTLEVASWAEAVGTFDLAAPTRENLGRWLDVMPSWADGTGRLMTALENTALEALLAAEEEVQAAVLEGRTLPPAPSPARPPARYRTLVPGHERPRQTQLGWWDRFQVADGFVPGALRFLVAGAVIAAVLRATA